MHYSSVNTFQNQVKLCTFEVQEPVGMVNSPQRKKAKKAKFIAASIMLSSVFPKQDDPSSLFKFRRISEVIGNLLFVMTR